MKLKTSEVALSDITRREGGRHSDTVIGSDIVPFRLPSSLIGGSEFPTSDDDELPTTMSDAGVVNAAPRATWRRMLLNGAAGLDRVSARAVHYVRRNANVRVAGLVYVAVLQVMIVWFMISGMIA